MENNKPGHISEKELDSLLNEAFLNLDFESNSKNKEVLAIVTKQAMRKNSLFTFFNVRRLNLLFLLLSFFACLTSFYRYIDSLSKENEKTNPVPEIKITEQKKPLVVLPITNYSIKSTNTHLIDNTSASTKIVTTHSAKKKFKTENKKNNRTILPVVSLEKNLIDSASKLIGSDSKIKNTDAALNSKGVDSLSNASQKKLPTSALISKSIETKPSKKIKPVKPETKGKVAKRRKGKRFFGDGTFRMKNRKYGKSR